MSRDFKKKVDTLDTHGYTMAEVMPMDTVGVRIKDARQKAGLSQEELARTIETTKSTISKYEKGLRQPRLEQLQAIADALGVDINWLVNGQTLEQRDQAIKDHISRRFTEAELDKRLKGSYDTLTLEGKEKAVDSVEIIAGNPAYQKPKNPPEGR